MRWRNASVVGGVVAAALVMGGDALRSVPAVQAAADHPVMVELFTSEGCSSCPPADDLLAQIAERIPNAVVLSEHVTYWNSGGWHDPFSLDESTQRQSDYVERMRLSSNYTPQMVVNGAVEFEGGDAHKASQAIVKASGEMGVPVSLSDVKMDADGRVSLMVDVGAAKSAAELIVVAAQDIGTKHVSNGENGGHTLRHVMIARSFTRAAKIKKDGGYAGRVTLALPEAISGSGWHVVAFVEQGRGGPIVGAASVAVPAGSSAAVARGE